MQSLPSDHQSELFEKFNAAFYDAQVSQNKNYDIEDDLLENFDESFFTNIDAYENDNDYFTDLLISKCSSASTESIETFDYTELSQSFDENATNETATTGSWQSDLELSLDCFPRENPVKNSPFFVPPPFGDMRKSPDDLYEVFFLNEYGNCQKENMDGFGVTMSEKNSDFTNFLRQAPGDSLDIFAEVS